MDWRVGGDSARRQSRRVGGSLRLLVQWHRRQSWRVDGGVHLYEAPSACPDRRDAASYAAVGARVGADARREAAGRTCSLDAVRHSMTTCSPPALLVWRTSRS